MSTLTAEWDPDRDDGDSEGDGGLSYSLDRTWEPHAGQAEIKESDARFRIVAAGRRFGKTELASRELFEEAFENPGTLNWWTAPDYRIADIGFNKIKPIIPDEFIEDITYSKPKSIDLINGSTIEFRSANKEDGLVGEGINFVVIDEASMVPSQSWKRELRPTLSDTMGRMLAISTPKGMNWFHDYWDRGQKDDARYDEIDSWQKPTAENPHIPASEIEAAKRELPERIFDQEYRAIFLDDSGGVFEKVRERIVEPYEWREERGEPPYYIGVDFARQENWTVITVMDGTGRLVHFWRGQRCSWPLIQRQIEDAYLAYEGKVFVDGTRDNKIVPDLREAGVPVDSITFTPQRKRQMIETLIIANEKESITIPDIPQLVSELQAFEMTVTAAGNVDYHAPKETGFHDDCVDSLALCNWARVGAGRKEVTRRGKEAHVSKASWLTLAGLASGSGSGPAED